LAADHKKLRLCYNAQEGSHAAICRNVEIIVFLNDCDGHVNLVLVDSIKSIILFKDESFTASIEMLPTIANPQTPRIGDTLFRVAGRHMLEQGRHYLFSFGTLTAGYL
jgi:hypothetical protein